MMYLKNVIHVLKNIPNIYPKCIMCIKKLYMCSNKKIEKEGIKRRRNKYTKSKKKKKGNKKKGKRETNHTKETLNKTDTKQ